MSIICKFMFLCDLLFLRRVVKLMEDTSLHMTQQSNVSLSVSQSVTGCCRRRYGAYVGHVTVVVCLAPRCVRHRVNWNTFMVLSIIGENDGIL
jgi:hypothetical protein